MKERKNKPEWTKDTERLGRKNQVIITRIRTGYTRATHSNIIKKLDNTDCPFCNTKLTVEHILWTHKETEQIRIRVNITKDVWTMEQRPRRYAQTD
jgi:predicted nucleic acid-binding protein